MSDHAIVLRALAQAARESWMLDSDPGNLLRELVADGKRALDRMRDEAERLRLAHREAEHRLAAHDCGEEASRLYVEAGEASALAMDLANALDAAHRTGRVPGREMTACCDGSVCALLERARRWAR